MKNMWNVTLTRDLTGVDTTYAENMSNTLNYWFKKSVYDTRQKAIVAALEDFRIEEYKGNIVMIKIGESKW